MIPLWIKVHAKQSEKEQIKRNVCKLPIRTIFAESNTNAQVVNSESLTAVKYPAKNPCYNYDLLLS